MDGLLRKVFSNLIREIEAQPVLFGSAMAELETGEDIHVRIESEASRFEVKFWSDLDTDTSVTLKTNIYLVDVKDDPVAKITSMIAELIERLKEIKKYWKKRSEKNA